MSLSERLASIPYTETINELNTLLNNAHVFISWGGQRRVSIGGYEGSVHIDKMAIKFLRSSPFTSSDSLQSRLTADTLWDRIKCLYEESDASLEQMPLYRWIVALKEKKFCRTTDPQTIIRRPGDPYRGLLFEFTPEEFTCCFLDQQPSSIRFNRHLATKEMIQQALQKNDLTNSPPQP